MSRPGSLISSAIEAIFVTPAYETNTRPLAANRPSTPAGRNGWKAAGSTAGSPTATNRIRTTSTTATTTVCTRPDSLVPTTLSVINAHAAPTATGRAGRWIRICRYAPSPTRANAALNTSENHTPKPATVPTSGPMARSMNR